MTAPLLVVDFEVTGAFPSVRDLVTAAADAGAAFVAVDVVDGEDETPEAHLGGRRVAALERMATEARRRQIGLWMRVRETLPILAMPEALGVAKGASSTESRERLLVVVADERVGKRLRREAPGLPSALELRAGGRKGLARVLPPNFLRAASDADDLVIPWDDGAAEALIVRSAPILAKRGARLWISDVRPDDVARATALGVAGVVVRRPLG